MEFRILTTNSFACSQAADYSRIIFYGCEQEGVIGKSDHNTVIGMFLIIFQIGGIRRNQALYFFNGVCFFIMLVCILLII